MAISAEIHTKDLLKTLEQFPQRVQKNVMVGAVRAGANVLVKEARANLSAHKKTGNLAKSIGVIKRKSNKYTWFSVTPRTGGKNDGYYAHMVEFGHDIVKNKKVVGFAQPVPFLRPAFESQDRQSIEASKKYIKDRIPKELAKAKR